MVPWAHVEGRVHHSISHYIISPLYNAKKAHIREPRMVMPADLVKSADACPAATELVPVDDATLTFVTEAVCEAVVVAWKMVGISTVFPEMIVV